MPDKSKIKLKYNSDLNLYNLKINSDLSNVFSLEQYSNVRDCKFSEGNWIFVLFAGYSGYDIIFVEKLLDLANDYDFINFGFKPYMDDRKIKEFSFILEKEDIRTTPVILFKDKNRTKIINSKQLSIESLISVLNSELF